MKSLAVWLFSTKPMLIAAASLREQEQQSIERWLTWMTVFVIVLIVGLLFFTLVVRHLAKRSTRPCRWCMEFIPKKAAVCPHCGKNVG